ncbi:unnamed protein product [Porites lobata]|uniref:Uncharacterized protein n=1 Tax=Porites lobata TaxID=104759 RepID=A0ABN8MXH8_9CNID|nr:unnamed protein product [Porites lobata]
MANFEASANSQAAMQRLKDELSDDEKNGNIGKIITYIADLCQTGWSFRQAYQNLGKLSTLGRHLEKVGRMLDNMTRDSKETILQVLDYQKKNCTEDMIKYCYDEQGFSLMELYKDIAQDKITKHEQTKEMILDAMKSFHQQESDKMISDMVKGSAFVAAFQSFKIYRAWEKISAASNVIEDRSEFDAIQKNLKKMEAMVTEFLDLCKRKPNYPSVNRKMMRINTLYTSTLGKISNLRVTIDGHIQCLDLQADYAMVDGAVNLATAATQVFQLLHTWSDLPSITKGIGMASVAAFMALAFGNYKVYQLSQDALIDLRKNLNEVKDLQNMLQDLHDQAAQVVEEMED